MQGSCRHRAQSVRKALSAGSGAVDHHRDCQQPGVVIVIATISYCRQSPRVGNRLPLNSPLRACSNADRQPAVPATTGTEPPASVRPCYKARQCRPGQPRCRRHRHRPYPACRRGRRPNPETPSLSAASTRGHTPGPAAGHQDTAVHRQRTSRQEPGPGRCMGCRQLR